MNSTGGFCRRVFYSCNLTSSSIRIPRSVIDDATQRRQLKSEFGSSCSRFRIYAHLYPMDQLLHLNTIVARATLA
jgi:hypothetical protein